MSPSCDVSRVSGAAPAGPFEIRRMCSEDAPVLARYHKEGIPTAFMSRLSLSFLSQLYRCIAESSDGFVFVAVDAGGRVIGFISGAGSINRVYRQLILRRGWLLAGLLLRYAVNMRTLRRLAHTLFYPLRVKKEYPKAELLSIVVDQASQGSGVATALLQALISEFRERHCPVFKVLVRADLARPNAFYRKHGFVLVDKTESHGVPSNIYVLETGLRQPTKSTRIPDPVPSGNQRGEGRR